MYWMMSLRDKYGGIVRVWPSPFVAIVRLAHPDTLKVVFGCADSFDCWAKECIRLLFMFSHTIGSIEKRRPHR